MVHVSDPYLFAISNSDVTPSINNIYNVREQLIHGAVHCMYNVHNSSKTYSEQCGASVLLGKG